MAGKAPHLTNWWRTHLPWDTREGAASAPWPSSMAAALAGAEGQSQSVRPFIISEAQLPTVRGLSSACLALARQAQPQSCK